MLPSLGAGPDGQSHHRAAHDAGESRRTEVFQRTEAIEAVPCAHQNLVGGIIDVFSRLSGCTSSVVIETSGASYGIVHIGGEAAPDITEHCLMRLRSSGASLGSAAASRANTMLIQREPFRDGHLLTGSIPILGHNNRRALVSVLLPQMPGSLGADREEVSFTALLHSVSEALAVRDRPEVSHLDWVRSGVVDRCVPWGYVVVDDEANVLFSNHRAQSALAQGGGIEIRSGRLRAARSSVDRVLHSIIANVAHEGDDGGAVNEVARVLGVPGTDGESRYALKIAPCDRCSDLDVPTAYVFIIDLRAELKASHSDLAILFSLTEKESQFAELFCQGHKLSEIAEMMGIAVNTARVHLHNLFKKTRTTSQVELAWKLARVL
ncbi:helix-turn-helix transcriptional regulator [Chelatococcus sp. SYSU_G07232]|uniref:Helix-turn-helix transcriptional regulator n=1 Tax=Chelatococcus albus TaxID=3047466 RepID=A0ABT7AEE0_9HYPH|nr:helix-turn-helix transcriptional regulator [Chelatococcus sp. SYSU_G07232]MDJ1157718.1 helix-turn-helix transcriptional regulator [Chelatococcus sp. SYSU_G07232]